MKLLLCIKCSDIFSLTMEENEMNIAACKYASNFPSQYDERKNAFLSGLKHYEQLKNCNLQNVSNTEGELICGKCTSQLFLLRVVLNEVLFKMNLQK